MYQIAVLDDSEIWCLVLKTMLSRCGFSVTTFTSPAGFLNVADRFDLALVDFSIPARSFQQQMDGCEVISQLKQHLEHPPVVILMSAYFTCDLLQTAHHLCPCADAYLSKDSMGIYSDGIQFDPLICDNPESLISETVQMEPLISAVSRLLLTELAHCDRTI